MFVFTVRPDDLCGSRAWCKNAAAHHLMVNRIMDPCGEEASWMLDIMEGIEFLRGGLGEPEYSPETNSELWFDLGGFNKCQPDYRRSVEMYAIRDQKPIKSVTVNGRPHTDFDPQGETVRLKPGSKQMTLRVAY